MKRRNPDSWRYFKQKNKQFFLILKNIEILQNIYAIKNISTLSQHLLRPWGCPGANFRGLERQNPKETKWPHDSSRRYGHNVEILLFAQNHLLWVEFLLFITFPKQEVGILSRPFNLINHSKPFGLRPFWRLPWSSFFVSSCSLLQVALNLLCSALLILSHHSQFAA